MIYNQIQNDENLQPIVDVESLVEYQNDVNTRVRNQVYVVFTCLTFILFYVFYMIGYLIDNY